MVPTMNQILTTPRIKGEELPVLWINAITRFMICNPKVIAFKPNGFIDSDVYVNVLGLSWAKLSSFEFQFRRFLSWVIQVFHIFAIPCWCSASKSEPMIGHPETFLADFHPCISFSCPLCLFYLCISLQLLLCFFKFSFSLLFLFFLYPSSFFPFHFL